MAEEEKKQPLEESKKTSKRFLLKERYEIQFDNPQSQHNTNGAEAFRVIDRVNPKRELFALICSNETAPRLSILSQMKTIDNPNILKLIEYGTVISYPGNSRNLGLIYQTPSGPRITDAKNTLNMRNDPDKFKHLFMSMLTGLDVYRSHGITNRSIRVDNLYYKDETLSDVIFGDCIASFPAFHQPPAYETIESLLANPEGRGNGSPSNDVYAVGVTALSLLYQKNLMQNMTTPEALRLKMRKGSYLALTMEDKTPSAYANLFKGILNDNIENRWDHIQAYNFLDGKTGNYSLVKNNDQPKKSITINGEKYYTTSSISIALQNYPHEGLEIVKSGKLLDWLRSGLENEKLYAQVERIIKQEMNISPPDILLSKICITINPDGPIRLSDIAIFPDGISKAIFYNIKKQNVLKPFYDIFSNDLIKLWYSEKDNNNPPMNAAEFKTYISRRDFGFGIERIMYDFDNDLPCISPLIGDELVISAPQLLKALDKNYERNKKTTIPFDKCIIAYLRCKLGRKIDSIIAEINSTKPNNQIAAALRMYSDIQRKYGPARLPNLARWLVNYSTPIVKSYHNKKFQKVLEKDIVKFAREGKIIDIYMVLENEETKNADMKHFTQALKEVNHLLTNKSYILSGSSRIDDGARHSALKLATIISILIMTLSLVITFVNWMLQ